MKAAVWYGKRDVRIEDFPEPSVGEGYVKAKVLWCGICGTDLHEYASGPILIPMEPHPLTGLKAPVILGHEFSAEVIECGKNVENLKPGDRIVTDPTYYCGGCFWCRIGRHAICEKWGGIGLHWHGAFAEYIYVKADCCCLIPPEVNTDVAALVEPLAVAVHAVRRGKILVGDSVVVIGAGPIGLMVLQAAKAAGAGRIFVLEVSPIRRKLAESYGAITFDPSINRYKEFMYDETKGIGPDVAIECVGHPQTISMAITLARHGGRVVVLGLSTEPSPIQFNEVVLYEKTIIGSLCYTDEFKTVLQLLADGRLTGEELITGRITLDELIEKGFEELIRNKERHIKILVKPN